MSTIAAAPTKSGTLEGSTHEPTIAPTLPVFVVQALVSANVVAPAEQSPTYRLMPWASASDAESESSATVSVIAFFIWLLREPPATSRGAIRNGRTKSMPDVFAHQPHYRHTRG